MFTSFSWTNYFLFIGVLLVLYAIIMLSMYYRTEMKRLFFSRGEAMQEMIDRPVDRLPMVHELVSELGVLIRTAGDNKTENEELFLSIQNLLNTYSVLGTTEYKDKISELIAQELKRYTDVVLSEEQLEMIWS